VGSHHAIAHLPVNLQDPNALRVEAVNANELLLDAAREDDITEQGGHVQQVTPPATWYTAQTHHSNHNGARKQQISPPATSIGQELAALLASSEPERQKQILGDNLYELISVGVLNLKKCISLDSLLCSFRLTIPLTPAS
jgi:hypothetical protein